MAPIADMLSKYCMLPLKASSMSPSSPEDGGGGRGTSMIESDGIVANVRGRTM